MGKKLYVGNLSYNVDDESLRGHFATIGEVESANVVRDRNSNRSKGFGFVEMASEEAASKAIAELNGKDYDGRKITVSEARPKAPREDRGGFRGGQGRW